MYYETDSSGNLIRALPGYYDGYHADLAGADAAALSDTQRDYLDIDPSRIILVEDSYHKLFMCKAAAIQEISQRCVDANYKMLPQYKRDNIYSGPPADDGYPSYLKGTSGKQSIAKMNKMYRDIANNAISAIKSAASIEEVELIVSSIVMPTESEIVAMIKE